MNREDIIRMAKEAGLYRQQHNLASNPIQVRFAYGGYEENIERFAKLVYESAFHDANIAASATIIDAAVLEEREACAKVAQETVCDQHIPTGIKIYGTKAAKAIRARGTE